MDTPTTTTTCDRCGKVLEVGDFPYCRKDGYHGKGFASVVDDTIIGGETVENMGHLPVTYFSKSERRRLMNEHGVEEFVRHQPLRGSDKSPHTVSWDRGSIDAQTIANAADLVDPARRQRGAGDTKPGFQPYPVTVRELPSE